MALSCKNSWPLIDWPLYANCKSGPFSFLCQPLDFHLTAATPCCCYVLETRNGVCIVERNLPACDMVESVGGDSRGRCSEPALIIATCGFCNVTSVGEKFAWQNCCALRNCRAVRVF